MKYEFQFIFFTAHKVCQITAIRQLRARRVLLIFKDVLLRTGRALSLYKEYGDSAFLVLIGTSLNSDSTLLGSQLAHYEF